MNFPKSLLQKPVVRFLAGVVAVGLASVARVALARVTGPDFPEYVLFYPTVMLVALLAGFWPALLALAAAAASILMFWVLPLNGSTFITRKSNFFGLALFIAVCLFLTVVAELYRRSRKKAAAHDVLEEKVQQRTTDLLKANRMLRMVSECDQALVQISDQRELTGVICQIIQDEGDYPLVWVGLTGDGEALHAIASAGDHDGFLQGMRAQQGDEALGGGPPGESVRSLAPVVCEDLRSRAAAPWREAALARGFAQLAAFPLLDSAQGAFGALVIYSDKPGDFNPGQVNLLKELADDLAFGITALQARVERDQALRALELKAAQLQVLAGEIVRTEERERRRIAQLLHDQLQQLLAATLYGLESLRTAGSKKEHRESFVTLGDQLRQCISISRSLTSEISHPALSEPDLTAALEWLAGWMKEKHGLEVTVRARRALRIDPEEIRIMIMQATRELLFNVVKHSGAKKASVLVGPLAHGRFQISVSDKGSGFDVEALGRAGSTEGSIGLFSIRERLALTGGGVDIESARGKGSTFTLWLPDAYVKPCEEGDAVSPRTGATRQRGKAAAPGGKIRILLVDDHTVVRNGIALQLRQQPDIEIVGEAADGHDAVTLARSLRPDVVCMDVNMPGMTGVEATRLIHGELPWVKVIGLSMFDEPKQIAEMRKAGAADYVSKSASLDNLLAIIRSTRRPRAPRLAGKA
jgi:signal transduction histidine kinase/ActR/RegA family two-component response regulator